MNETIKVLDKVPSELPEKITVITYKFDEDMVKTRYEEGLRRIRATRIDRLLIVVYDSEGKKEIKNPRGH